MADGDVGFGRLEVLSGPTGRRRWPDEVKARIVAESFLPGARVGDVARRHDVVPSQRTTWRRLAREGRLALPWDFAGEPEPGFVPLMVEDATEDAGLPPTASDGGSSAAPSVAPSNTATLPVTTYGMIRGNCRICSASLGSMASDLP